MKQDVPADPSFTDPPEWPFLTLRGIGKDVFESFGGGETHLRYEREHFYDSIAGA